MARFRRKMRARRIGAKSRRIHHSGLSPIKVIVSGAAYGALRPTIVSAISPISSMLPLAGYGNHVILGVGGWFLSKKGGLAKTIGTAMLFGEAFSLGSGMFGNGGSSSGGVF